MTTSTENLGPIHRAGLKKWRSAEERLLGSINPSSGNDHSLFLLSIFEDEKPLKGLPGAIDWRLRGFLSRFVKAGKITGKLGEKVYIPIEHGGKMRPLLVIGLGAKKDSGDHARFLNPTFVQELGDTVKKLSFKTVVISKSCFPFWPTGDEKSSLLKKNFSGVEIEYTL